MMTMMTHSENKVKVVPELNLDAVEVVLNSKICEPPCLMRMPYIAGNDYVGEHEIRLEAVATKAKICMNKNGKLYVKHNNSHRSHVPKENQNETKENVQGGRKKNKWRRKKKKKSWGQSKEDPTKVNECTFRIHNFHPNESYYKAAIYSAAYSTPTEGRFVAFGRDGFPRSVKKPFKNLAAHARVGMLIEIHSPHSIERVINNTTFSMSKKINHKVRQCIHNRRKNSHVFSTQRYRYDKVTQVIRTCRRQYDPRFRRRWENSRKLLKQNSMQRDEESSQRKLITA